MRVRNGPLLTFALDPDSNVDPAVLASVAYVATLRELISGLREATVDVGPQVAISSVRIYGSSTQ